jgi:hypothetical protein
MAQGEIWSLGAHAWWVHVGVVVGMGTFGGLLNAILAGGPDHTIRFAVRSERVPGLLHLGVWGSMLVGIGAAVVAWATAFHQTPLPVMIGGCLLAALAGAGYLTSRATIAALDEARTNQTQTIQSLVESAAAVSAVREESVSPEPDEREE